MQYYNTSILPTWCPGCGNYVIRSALVSALTELNIEPHQVALTFDIGCLSNGADKINAYTLKSLHGRAIPPAVGIKYANFDLPVVALLGEGGAYGEGIDHLISAAQRNDNITVIVANNGVYALTTGQTSPTSQQSQKTASYPEGTLENPINPLQIALSSGATFVARGYTGDLKHLSELIKLGIQHQGFSLIDVLQNCPTWNKGRTIEYYREKVAKLEDAKEYRPNDKFQAFKYAEDNNKIWIGVFYKSEETPSHKKYVTLRESTLVKQKNAPRNIDNLLNELE